MDINWILLDIINTGEGIETASTTYQTWNDAIKAFYRGLANGSDDSALSHTFLIMDIFGKAVRSETIGSEPKEEDPKEEDPEIIK